IEKQFFAVCRRESFRVLGDPQFREVGWKPGEALVFSAVFDVFPEFVPEGYKAIKLDKPAVEVTEEEIESQIESLRERTATFAAAEKEKLEEGDFGVIDFRTIESGESGAPSGSEAKWVEGFFVEVTVRDDAPLLAGMVGMKPGETRLIETGEGPEGERVFEVKLREIKKKVLPPLDDEWAAS
nr:trigger factor [bacterium]